MEASDEVRAGYAAAAQKFREALGVLGPAAAATKVRTAEALPVSYFLKLELANSLLFAGYESGLEEAMALYGELAGEFPNDPTVKLRFARAMIRLDSSESSARRALDICKDSIALIDKDPQTGRDHWLILAAYIQTGYTYWRLADRVGPDHRQEEEVLLRSAVAETEKAYDRWIEMGDVRGGDETYRLYVHKALSNIVYYLASLIRMGAHGGGADRKTLELYLDRLQKLPIPKYLEYYKTRDNIMQAHVAMGNRDEAAKLARENVLELKKIAEARAGRPLPAIDAYHYLRGDEVSNLRTASALLADPSGTV